MNSFLITAPATFTLQLNEVSHFAGNLNYGGNLLGKNKTMENQENLIFAAVPFSKVQVSALLEPARDNLHNNLGKTQ